ncbi:sugar phosphate isomerase/epimerase family protein [Chthonobacter albigriseus]|uniref:sugar phosphate isomerase/epimerase family protein n=1 Tax=Chthonobacter albigriseus TaxID=1683161 RepID=UPI0015EF767B|nr:sugar phosphate isomerase/epimerase [Chthonobacter albigriseus]
MQRLRIYQSLWAAEHGRPGVPPEPLEEIFNRVKAAGYHGLAIDLGVAPVEAARVAVPHYARTGLGGLVTAFPRSIEGLRPALHLAKDIGAPFVVVVGQIMPVTVEGMIPVIRDWLKVSAEEGMPIQFETHRNCITNDLFSTLQLLDAIPEMRLAADLSHYVVDREMKLPLFPDLPAQVSRILARSDSFQGRIASRNQIQLQIDFPQHQKWVDLFKGWWAEGFRAWRARAPEDAELVFLCELGPPEYAITDSNGEELSDRWAEALVIAEWAREIFAKAG